MVTLGSPTPAESLKSEDMEELRLFEYHLSLLDIEPQHQGLEEAITTPIFTMPDSSLCGPLQANVQRFRIDW
jgi:hypothetical protein